LSQEEKEAYLEEKEERKKQRLQERKAKRE